MGRPKSDNPRNITVRLRLNSEEVDMLEYVQRKTGLTKSEIIRNALRWAYVLEKAIECPKSEKGKNDGNSNV